MKTSSAKAKGRSLQGYVRDLILSLWKELTPNDVRSTSSGSSGRDILLSTEALKRVPLAIECKNLARIAVYKFYEQAKAHTDGSEEPVVVMKQNRDIPLVLVRAEYFFKLLKDANDKKE